MKTAPVIIGMLVAGIFFTACKKKKEEEEPQPFASFTISGTAWQFNSHTKFNKTCLMSYFCGDFLTDKAFPNQNSIAFGFPQDVASGKTFITGNNNFYVLYLDPTGNRYYSYYGGNFTVNVTQWDGNGGWVKATFSGSLPLEDNPLNDSVVIQNGKFEGKIYYVETK